MECIRKFIPADKLAQIVDLPESFTGAMVEAILVVNSPSKKNTDMPSPPFSQLEVAPSIRKLRGIASGYTGDLDTARAERLKKYENPD